MDDFNSNLRGFRSNQSISDINNIHADLFIESYNRRNQNIDEKLRGVNLYEGGTDVVCFVAVFSYNLFLISPYDLDYHRPNR
jgi:hypothetical protein